MFNSGARILEFYELRKVLFAASSGEKDLLKRMREIVRLEKEASSRMIDLCRNDPRLGYHSEAEVFKFYPKKLAWRISELEKLEPAFDLLEGKTPEEIRRLLAWEGPCFRTGETYRGKTFSWRADVEDRALVFRIRFAPLPEGGSGESAFFYLMDRDGAAFPFILSLPGGSQGYEQKNLGIGIVSGADGELRVTVPPEKTGYADTLFVGVLRRWRDADGEHCDATPEGDYSAEGRLNLGDFSTERLGKLLIGR